MIKTARAATFATAFGLAFAGAAAFAQDEPEPAEPGMDMPTFEEADTNKNGVVSRAEAATEVPDLDFATADENQDGVLTRDEYDAATS